MLLRQFDEFFPLFFFPGFLAEFSEQMPFQVFKMIFTLQVYQFYILQHDVNQDYLLFQQPFQYWDYPSFNLTEFLTTKYSTNFAFSFGIFQVFIQKSFLDFRSKNCFFVFLNLFLVKANVSLPSFQHSANSKASFNF